MARRADLAEKTIVFLEKGGIDPQERTLIRLAAVLGTSVAYLARGEGRP